MFKFLKIADGLGRKLVIVQTKWDGLAPYNLEKLMPLSPE